MKTMDNIVPPCLRVFRKALWAFFMLLVAGGTIHADFYVSPNGSDQFDGGKDKPFATLERVRDAVRELKRAGNVPAGGLTVWLRAGDTFRTNTLELTEADSGSPGAPITWQAYANERVRLVGGRTLRGFTPVTDPSVVGRLEEKARDHVLQCDLRVLGIKDFGEMKSRGFGRPGTPAHCELFFEHRPMTLARWPNEGQWEKIAGFPEATGAGDEHGGKIGDLRSGFFYTGERPRRWRDTRDVWVHGYWAWDWANSYERVAEIDRDQHLLRTAPPNGLYGFRKGQRFYFLNLLEELDEPGEWFLDHENGVLYFWPPSTEKAPTESSVEAILSLLPGPFFKLTGASNVVVCGLILEATRGSAVEIRGGSSNLIRGCLIRNIGESGVVIEGGLSHGIRDCDIFDTGDGGVSLSGGDRQTLTPSGHFVENCHFQRQGRWSKCYVPAVALNGVGQRVSHNLIHDHPHAAILFRGNDHLIEFNEIHHIALETGDVGAIYTGRDYSFRGNRIRSNYIHETGGVGMGSMGVYMDDCVSGTEVFGNVFYKVHWAMFIGGGRDHRVENNIFVDCDPAVRADGRGLDSSPVWREMVNDYMRKQLAAVPLSLYRERYPAMKALDAYYGSPEGPAITGAAFKGVPPENNLIARNVAVGKWFEAGWHSKPEMFLLSDNFVTADQNQIGTPAEGFRLPKDSPAWKLGFQPIPFEQIGLQPNEDRARLRSFAKNEKPFPFFPFCIDWNDARKRSFEQQATMLKELGYDGVGHLWLDNVAERLKTLDEAGLKLFQITMTVDVGPSTESRQPYDAKKFNETLALVKGRNVQFCLLLNGMKPSDPSVDPHAVEIVRKMSDLAKESRAQLLLYHHQASWIERIEDAVRVAEKVNRPNVGVMFNLCHWLRVDKSRDYTPLLREAMPRLWAVSINGADVVDEQPGWSHYIQPLDSGNFDLATFLGTLENLGYTGPIGLQCYGIGGDARDHLARSMTAWKTLQANLVGEVASRAKP